MTFNFQDDDLGNVAEFNSVELDFGYLTGPNFNGGSPNDGLDNFQTLSFTISGSFAGFTEEEIASGLYVRFQRVGPSGNLSDVASVRGGESAYARARANLDAAARKRSRLPRPETLQIASS